MFLAREQVEEILGIIDYHHLFVISTNFGTSMLSELDKAILLAHGVNIDSFPKISNFDRMYLFGILSSVLQDEHLRQLDYRDLKKYIETGQYKPLSKREKDELEIARHQSYVHLKGLKQKVKSQVETMIYENEKTKREQYELAIKQGIEQGVAKRKSISSIISDIGHSLNEWKHDWGRIVETEMNNVYQLGIAKQIEEKRGRDALVYKQVYPQACRHCIRLYLTKGLGSKPIVYKLSDLAKNGTNIGVKVADWKPIIGSTHPYCRCHLYDILPGHEWNSELKRFELPAKWTRKVERRSKVIISVGDKKFEV